MLTEKQDFIVCEGIAAQKPDDFEAFVAELVDGNYLKKDSGGHYTSYVPFMTKKDDNQPYERRSVTHKKIGKGLRGVRRMNGAATIQNGLQR